MKANPVTQINIVTDIAPLSELTQLIAGPDAKVQKILPPGTTPHQYSLRPSQMRALADADLVITIGPALTPWMQDAMQSVASDAAQLVFTEIGDIDLLSYHQTEDHQSKGQNHTDVDPHLWLNPDNVAIFLKSLAADLSEQMPEGAETFAKNLGLALAKIENLSQKIETITAGKKQQPYLVMHDSLAYFSRRFNLARPYSVLRENSQSLSAARLSKTYAATAALTKVCLFTDPETDALARSVFAETPNVKQVKLDIFGQPIAGQQPSYLEMLSKVAAQISDCLEWSMSG